MKRSTLTATALLTATLAAGTASASPAATIGGIATKLMDEALGFGIGEALGSLTDSETYDLSEQAYSRIDAIVTDAVNNGRFADWQIQFENVVEDALLTRNNPDDQQ